jgi:hypothetical protein
MKKIIFLVVKRKRESRKRVENLENLENLEKKHVDEQKNKYMKK